MLWEVCEPWLPAVSALAREPAALLAELPEWAALIDQHSTVELERAEGATRILWRNLPGIGADSRECAFRLGALASLLGPEVEVGHPSCRGRGDAECAFRVAGLFPRRDPRHARVLREVMLLSGSHQGREAVFRRLGELASASEPFPDIHGIRAVRRFMEELEDAILIFGRNLWVLDANRSAVALFGMSVEELRGCSARDLFSSASLASLKRALPELYRQGSLRGLVLEGRARERLVPLEVAGRVADGGGTLVFLARDIGEHLSLERELERRNLLLEESNEQIAQADRLKSEFLANVSHELTTPLTCIKGFSRLLHADVEREVSADAPRLDHGRRLEFLDIMGREAERVLRLIKGLLELSTLEAGGAALDRARVSVNTVVRECLLLMKPRLDERGLRAECRLDPTMPLALLDPNRIKQVVLNLLENAAKFAPAGETIRILTGSDRGRIRLVVENASSDLEEGDLQRIFDRFVQRDGTFSRQYGGVGLGLNLVRAIVELHGGSVSATLPAPDRVQLAVELPTAAHAEPAGEGGSMLSPKLR
ncbi:MAG: ATP-binding protein [Myxococcota bacterium]